MKHVKRNPDGTEHEERLNVEPRLPTGGGGGASGAGLEAPADRDVPPPQGPEVEIEDVGYPNLSQAPRDREP